jgi:hypothetical protein
MKKASRPDRRRKKASKKRRPKSAKTAGKQSLSQRERLIVRRTAIVSVQLAEAPPLAKEIIGEYPVTLAKVLRIISSYGIVPYPTPATIVGPAVPSMGQFTLDVNNEFGRSYVLGQLKSTWTANQTAIFIDNNP